MTPRRLSPLAPLLLALACAVACGGGAASEASETTPAASPSGATVDLPNARTPWEGLLVGGPPSAEALQQAADAGYRTVVSARMPGEPGSEGEQAQVEALGMRFVSIPVDRQAGPTPEDAAALDAILSDAGSAPVLLHCGSGNRAAALLGLRQGLHQGASPDEAVRVARDAGMTSDAFEAAIRERVGAR